ncbi:MAG TPA: UvrD-helicase domain-containing protein [Polyangiaceae bacterium]|jgi:DNA helicase-2/ATP-dependent DNA helicase PcrA
MSIPLNPAQKRAVEHFTGPILVLAGAGSGKTRVITERIARLLERGISARQILALTFTNKAAGEMAERIAAIAKARKLAAKELTVSTFHSFGLMALGRERTAIGGAFTIFDQGDSLGVVKEALRGLDMDGGRRFDAPAILARISLAKNAFVDPANYVVNEEDEYDLITREVYPRYQSALRSFRAFDFDDLVCELARLLRTREDVLSRFQDRYRFILVDEYQDTNVAQLELLRHLGARDKNVCVVGDDDQAIYGWRGADVRNILEFENHFPGAAIVKLEQNYRSRPEILAVANAVISKRQDSKHEKTLFSTKPSGALPVVLTCSTPEAEASWVAREARKLIHDEHVKPSQIAVLYRSNGQARPIEEAMREQGVGYRVVGGQQFFERKEVKDLLSYLKLALHRNDEIALRRVVNYPARGVGEQSLQRLATHATANDWTLWQAIERIDAIDDIPTAARNGCADLEKTIAEARKRLLVERQPASGVVRWLCERVGLKGDVEKSSSSNEAAARRWGNVEGLAAMLGRREERERTAGRDPTSEDGLRMFIQAMMLDTSDDDEDDKPKELVLLSTLHGSKGLEFDHVFLIGCEEGYLPHARTQADKATDATGSEMAKEMGVSSDVEEERRLFYVGITRAREKLVISRCEGRAMRGKAIPRTPSRFLSDIPEDAVTLAVCKDARPMSTDEAAASANALLAALEGLG